MKIGFVFQKDSHLKAVQATALRLSAQYPDAQIQFYGISVDLCQQSQNGLEISLLRDDSFGELSDCNYLVCCLGGYLLNQLIRYYKNTDTKIIALFPGVVSHYQLDAFISRFNADQVWLNCPADAKLYADLCHVYGVKNNGLLYGACWVGSLVDNSKTAGESINSQMSIFFEQTQIINDALTAQRLKNQLLDIFQKNPSRQFLYKTRNNFLNEHMLMVRESVKSLPNVCIVDKLTGSDLILADEYLSISSSAIIEGLLLGKNCCLLGRDYLDEDNLEIFSGSGLFLEDNQAINKGWYGKRICKPCQMVDLQMVIKQKYHIFQARSLLNIYKYILRLSAKHLKMLYLLQDGQRLQAIQKSLEYIS